MPGLKSIVKSKYLQSISIRATGAVFSFIASVLLARLLGPEEYGKYGILLSVATVLAIPFSTGLSRAITRETAEARVTGDSGRIPDILKKGTQLFFVLLAPLAILAAILFTLDVSVAGNTTGIIIAAVLAPLLAADSNRIGAMQGLGSAIGSQIPDQVVRPIAIIVIVLVILDVSGSADAVTGATAYSAAALFSLLLGGVLLRMLLHVNLTGEPAKATVSWSHFVPLVATMSVLGGSKVLTSSIDMLILNWLGDLSGAGHYKVALAGLAVASMGMTAIRTVLYTRIAASIPAGETAQTLKTIDGAIGWQLLITGSVVVLIAVIGRPVISLLYGSEYLEAWPILLVLSVGFFIASVFGPSEEILMLKGRQLMAATVILLAVVFVIIIAAVLGPALGAIGVAVAATVGTLFRAIILMFLAQSAIGANPSVFGSIGRRWASRSSNETNQPF